MGGMFLAAGPACLERPKQRKGGFVNQGPRHTQGRRITCFRKAKVKAVLELLWARQSSAVPINTSRAKSIVSRAGCCSADGSMQWIPHIPAGAALLHVCTQPVGNAADAVSLQNVIQHSCEMAICLGYPDIQHLERCTQHCSEQQRLCCCKQQNVHGGRSGRSAECAWIQCSWDPDTAVPELYQEHTTTELFPNPRRITGLGSQSLVLLGREEERTSGWGSNGIIHYLFLQIHLLVHIQSLHCLSNLSVHHFQLAYCSFALSHTFLSGFHFLCAYVDPSFSFILLSHEKVFLQVAFLI